jgi:glycosyltransferase involved in cell wall biosynthesis
METNSKALGIKKEKVKVIYRGRSSKKFDSVSDQEAFELRLKLNINSDTKILLNVSRLLDRKGQLDLLKSYAEVVKTHPDTILLFAGEGAFRATLEKAIDDLQLKEKVVLLGNVDYIPLLLKMADIFIFPSHYEGLPGALLEAMFVQKIIICSDIGENNECVSETEAIFFKTHDIEDLTIKISMVLNNLKEYVPMAINAKKAAISKFDLATIISHIMELIKIY